MVFANFTACHRDPRFWKKPNDFHPGHFLDENGNFKPAEEGFLPYGYGRNEHVTLEPT